MACGIPGVGVSARPIVSPQGRQPQHSSWFLPRIPETLLPFDGAPAPNNVDALCALAGWSRADLAHRLGLGAPVLDYYVRDRAPRWLAHALIGIAVAELGLCAERARELLDHAMPADSKVG